ncbi:hypothetical protein FF125_15155 [Aureibaculum algae]|uniref:YD repeat-containing protein n=1 Tax=Aureibaculum algae TaxID=2584122 RepID=A0A5B7TX49_9FLAO|nr:hypothetical protein [Aureibaculum algae]QCX39716.1 hypothetical protein FF125_15155 [Aureibaculum algae]
MKSTFKNIVLFMMTLSNLSISDIYGQQSDNIRLISYAENTNKIDLSYNDNNLLTSIGYTTLNYDSESRIDQIGKVSYAYNELGQISKIINEKTASLGNLETEITYDKDSLITSFVSKYGKADLGTATSTFEYDKNKRLKRIIEKGADGRGYGRITLAYDDKNNIVQQLKEKSYDGTSYRQVTVSNYTYDTKNNPDYNVLTQTGNSSEINLFHLIYNIAIGGQSAYETVYYYSKNNILSSEVISVEGNAATQTYSYVYDKNNYPVSAELEYAFSSDTSFNRKETRAWVYEKY